MPRKPVGILNQHRLHRRTTKQRRFVARENTADKALVEGARSRVLQRAGFDHFLVELIDCTVVVEGAATLFLPAAGDSAMELAACMPTAPLRDRVKP